ncbi:bifunctional RNase H/acid phosphatase, partial [Rhodococcus erythropolis]
MTPTQVIVEADGGSRGNPGPAGYGAVVFDSTRSVLAERKESIGIATNNVAEYRGLIAGLTAAGELGASTVDVRMDSKLVVEQMSGRWKVKHPDMIPLQRRAAELATQFSRVTYTWIPRGENSHADRLANEAMDAAAGIETATPAPAAPAAPSEETSEPQIAGSPGWIATTGKPTRMLLLRHGQTAMSVDRRYSGRGNPELTELGRAQAAGAAARFGNRGGIDAIVCSPLGRTRETAEASARVLGLPVVEHKGLIETDFGDWDGLTFREAAERDPDLHREWLSDTSVRPPGGESFDEVRERVVAARDDLISTYGGAT